MRLSWLLIPSLACAWTAPALAYPLHVGFTVEVASVSSYVLRGDRLSSDAMSPAVQSYGELVISELGPGALTTGVWTASTIAERQPVSEIDPYFAYTIAIGDLSLRGGYTVTLAPEAEVKDSVHELTLSVTTAWELPVQLFIGAAVDPIRTEGAYGYAGAQLALSDGPLSFNATFNVGGSGYAALAPSLQDVTLQARAAYTLADSGVYVAATAGGAWSGRAAELYPFARLGVGVAAL